MEPLKMELSDTAKSLLMSCAQAIANGTEVNLNLFTIAHELRQQDLVLRYLMAQVEVHSSGNLTVRFADPQVIDQIIMGHAIYLASCPLPAPQEVVTKVTEGMKLYSLGPYRNGFSIENQKM